MGKEKGNLPDHKFRRCGAGSTGKALDPQEIRARVNLYGEFLARCTKRHTCPVQPAVQSTQHTQEDETGS